jgi:hypothetical protein
VKILAYCTLPAARAVAKATGAAPLTSPPLTAETFKPGMLKGYDLIYIRLHGTPKFPNMWLGENSQGAKFPALEKHHIDNADLTGAIVVLANCYGASSPLVAEMYEAGASTVIAGGGPNFAAANRVVGTDLLVQWLIRGLRPGLGVEAALRLAKARLLAGAWRVSDRDALRFKIIEKQGETHE